MVESYCNLDGTIWSLRIQFDHPAVFQVIAIIPIWRYYPNKFTGRTNFRSGSIAVRQVDTAVKLQMPANICVPVQEEIYWYQITRSYQWYCFILFLTGIVLRIPFPAYTWQLPGGLSGIWASCNNSLRVMVIRNLMI